jgi:hypothetical protein
MLSPEKLLERKTLAALMRLKELLSGKGVIGELCIIDNATRVIFFAQRDPVDTVKFDAAAKMAVLNCARQVADELALEEDWMKPRNSGFTSDLKEVTHDGITITYYENLRQDTPKTVSSYEKSLYESMLFISNSVDFDDALFNFLDQFKWNPNAGMLIKEPLLLATKLNDGGLVDAYLASTVDHLCQHRGLEFPSWVNQPSRVLQKPWFAAKSPNLKAILLQESPAAFRVRNLFVSANALHRA